VSCEIVRIRVQRLLRQVHRFGAAGVNGRRRRTTNGAVARRISYARGSFVALGVTNASANDSGEDSGRPVPKLELLHIALDLSTTVKSRCRPVPPAGTTGGRDAMERHVETPKAAKKR